MTTWGIPATGRHTSFYGPRNTGIPGASTFHRGHDIAPPYPGQRGVPVRSVGPGRVAGRDYNSARGWFVRIRHDDGSMTLYQHLDRIDVVYGQRVATRTQVGLMGDSGVGAGVHLHFECYPSGVNAYILANAVDPVRFMRDRGVNLLTGAQLASNPRPTPTPTPPSRPTPPEDDDMPLSDDDIDKIARRVWYFVDKDRGHTVPRYDAVNDTYLAVRSITDTLAALPGRIALAVWGFKRSGDGKVRGPDRIDVVQQLADALTATTGKAPDRIKHPAQRQHPTDF